VVLEVVLEVEHMQLEVEVLVAFVLLFQAQVVMLVFFQLQQQLFLLQ
tara:strand:+ start:84 stop:224 length:141 start_codon:yes stop_codon:yes gene_type:complete